MDAKLPRWLFKRVQECKYYLRTLLANILDCCFVKYITVYYTYNILYVHNTHQSEFYYVMTVYTQFLCNHHILKSENYETMKLYRDECHYIKVLGHRLVLQEIFLDH